MRRKFRMITVLAAAFLVVGSIFSWLIFSMFTMYNGDGDAFQRLGSFGVFSWLLLLAYSRVNVEKLESERVKSLVRQTAKAKSEAKIHGSATKYRAAQVSWYEAAEKFTWRQRYLLASLELIGIGVATLQWGYGDLLVQIFHG